MTIRDIGAFVEGLPDWAMLAGCFGTTTIRPTDIDGCVERRGACLFLEKKRPGVSLSEGQRRTFKALAAQGNTVIVFWAHGDVVEELLMFEAARPLRKTTADTEDFRSAVASWFNHVDSAQTRNGGINDDDD